MKLAIVVLMVLLIGLQYRLWVGDGSLSEVVQLKAELKAQSQLVERLSRRNRLLENRVIDLQSGTQAIEELARKDLGMIKEGEVFFQIVTPVTSLEKSQKHDKP